VLHLHTRRPLASVTGFGTSSLAEVAFVTCANAPHQAAEPDVIATTRLAFRYAYIAVRHKSRLVETLESHTPSSAAGTVLRGHEVVQNRGEAVQLEEVRRG
jgi:hypothetical protein